MDDARYAEDVAALYEGAPERFVAARDELASRLNESGDAEAAKRVKALRRPTTAAWAVDRAARARSTELEALVRAGDELAAAQRAAAAGSGAESLREATEERRRLVGLLVGAAKAELERAGMAVPRATLDKVENTFMAIASDEGAGERVARGTLDKELPAPAGFGDDRLDAALLASVSELPRPPDEPPAPRETEATPSQVRRERERARRAATLAAEAENLQGEADRLEHAAKEAESHASAARKAATAARRKADSARRRADAAG